MHRLSPIIQCTQGYCTQDDVREIVASAQKRFVTIIPEIELPGHSSAAVAAYPELSCGIKNRYEVVKTFGIFDNVFCPNEKTFRFLEDVFSEVAALFPGTYIHIGGDECAQNSMETMFSLSRADEKIKSKG